MKTRQIELSLFFNPPALTPEEQRVFIIFCSLIHTLFYTANMFVYAYHSFVFGLVVTMVWIEGLVWYREQLYAIED